MAVRKTPEQKAAEEAERRAKHRAQMRRERRLKRKIAAEDKEREEDPEYKADQVAKTLGKSQVAIAGSKSPKVNISAKAKLSEAFDMMGGVPGLVRWGKKNPTEFYRIWGKLIGREEESATKNMPLEDLLAKLSERAEMSVLEAAQEIGEEALNTARDSVNLEDAMLAFKLSEGETIQ